MPENTTDATQPEQPTLPDAADELGDKGKGVLSDALKARRAAEMTIAEQRKEIDKLQKRLKGLEDRDKTEEQRRAEELEAAKAQASAAEQREARANLSLLRYQVGARKGLDADLIARLVGDTEDELETDAEALAEKYGASAQRAPRTPAPDRTLGRGKTGSPSTAEQFASAMQKIL